MAKDIVIGTAKNYDWPQIRTWANSLDQSGFDGIKIVLMHSCTQDAIDQLTKRNYTIVDITTQVPQFHPVVDRFIYYYQILMSPTFSDCRYVIATDTRDVVFQSNPSEYLTQSVLKENESKYILASEQVRYEDEPWNQHNLFKSFGPMLYEFTKNKIVVNAGVMAGKFHAMRDLFLNIFLLCEHKPRYIEGGGGPDQAAYNILMNMQHYVDVSDVYSNDDAWAAQLGTIGPQVNFPMVPVNTTAQFVDNKVCNSFGEPYVIAHQYDRVPEWKEILEKKYE